MVFRYCWRVATGRPDLERTSAQSGSHTGRRRDETAVLVFISVGRRTNWLGPLPDCSDKPKAALARAKGHRPFRRESLEMWIAGARKGPIVGRNESSEPTLSFVGDFD